MIRDVKGWMTECERMALKRWAFGRSCLEIGSYEGLSTIQLAATGKSVVAVDTFDGRGTAQPRETLDTFKANLIHFGLHNKVQAKKGMSKDVLPALRGQHFDMIFIDGSHDYESVSLDAKMSVQLLKKDGIICFHDYDENHPGVVTTVNDLVKQGARITERVNSLACLTFAKPEPQKPIHIFVAMPHRNRRPDPKELEAAARHMCDGNRPMRLTVRMSGQSVLTLNFNTLLALALNERASDGVTDFAMLHDDVFPEAGWLSVLLNERERMGVDAISAVVPIKNNHGNTSTGIDTLGDPWSVRRLTMTEVFDLPETFTAEDVPWRNEESALLVNSGCWLMKLDVPWIEGMAFKQTDRVVFDPTTKEYCPQSISEDWDWSRQLYARGARVAATRKVRLCHERAEYHNHSPWGEWKIDEGFAKYHEIAKANSAA